MQYRVPHQNVEFEIPDAWWAAADATGFVPSGPAFIATSDPQWPTTLVAISRVAAPLRDPGVVGLHFERTVGILRVFREGTPLPPLEVHQPPALNTGYLRVRDGYHRYYASVAAGFLMLPVSLRPYFDFNAL